MAKNEISRFIARADADISRAIVAIADSIAHRFRCRIPNANAAADDPNPNPNPNPDIYPSIVLPVTLTEEEIDRFVAFIQPIIHKICIVAACQVGIVWIVNGYFFNLIRMVKMLCDFTVYSIVVQLEQPKPIERCLSLSKYSRTPYLKGLKDILETDMGCTQEVEQHLEGTSRAVVPSSESTEEKPLQGSIDALQGGEINKDHAGKAIGDIGGIGKARETHELGHANANLAGNRAANRVGAKEDFGVVHAENQGAMLGKKENDFLLKEKWKKRKEE